MEGKRQAGELHPHLNKNSHLNRTLRYKSTAISFRPMPQCAINKPAVFNKGRKISPQNLNSSPLEIGGIFERKLLAAALPVLLGDAKVTMRNLSFPRLTHIHRIPLKLEYYRDT